MSRTWGASDGSDELDGTGPPAAGAGSRPRLPGFVAPDEDPGLGDLIKRATSAIGITPCRGCAQRAERLNRWSRSRRRRQAS